MCLAPLLLAGYLFTLHPNHWHVTSENGGLVEVQSCERGIGVDAKATTSGLYALEAQYGLQWRQGDWSLTFTPKAGGAYHDVQISEEQSKLTFSLSAQLTVGYKDFRLSGEYWHNSNAGLGQRNAGLDMIGIMAGWAF